MNDSPGQTEPDDFVRVLAEFHADLDRGADPEAVIRDYAARYPAQAKEFRDAARMGRILDYTAEDIDDYRPERLGDFRIVREISRGGMKIIYEAVQEPLGRRVAVATIRKGRILSPHRERFLREQRVLAKLHQTNIVPVFAAGEDGPIQYFAMPYIEGAALSHVVRAALERGVNDGSKATPPLGQLAEILVEGDTSTGEESPGDAVTEEMPSDALPPPGGDLATQTIPLSQPYLRSVARVMAGVANSLQHAHEHGFLHRDLKPANIMVDTSEHSWLIDFGLAGFVQASERLRSDQPPSEIGESLTQMGQVMGTPGYMAPEQNAGKPTDQRTDVWGLGVTLYELLTFRPAFPSLRQEERGEAAEPKSPKRPRRLIRGLPRDLEAVCLKALQADAGRRYETAAAFGADLRRWLEGEPTVARPARAPRRAYLWARHNKGWAFAMAVSLLALIALGVSGLLVANAAERARKAQLFDSLLLQIDRMTRSRDGWSEEARELVRNAADTETDDESADELRDAAVTTLIGLDAHVFSRLPGPASTITFDTEGDRLLCGGFELGGARLWDIKSDEVQLSEQAGSGPVVFAADGSPWQMVVESSRRYVIWDVAKNQVVRTLDIPFAQDDLDDREPLLPAMAVTPHGGFLAASPTLPDGSGTVAVWNALTRDLLCQFPMKASALAFTSDGSLLAAGDDSGQIVAWSVSSGEEVARLQSEDSPIDCLEFGRDPKRPTEEQDTSWLLAAGAAGGTVTVWDLSRKIPRSYCRGSAHNVYDLEFSPDGVTLASCGRYVVRLWDIASGQHVLDIRGGNTMYGVAFSADGNKLAFTRTPIHDAGPQVTVVELEFGRGIRTLRGLSATVSKVWFSRDGKLLAALSHDWSIAIWSAKTGRLMHILRVPKGFFADNAGLNFTPDGRQVAFSAGDRATLWDLASGKLERMWELPPGLGDRIRFHPNGKLLLFRFETEGGELPPMSNAPPDRHPRVCRLRDLTAPDPTKPIAEISEFNWHVFSTAAAPDGSTFVAEGNHSGPDGERRTVRAFDGLTGDTLWSISVPNEGSSGNLMIDPAGKLLLFDRGDGSLGLVELRSAKFRGQRESTNCVSPKARLTARHGVSRYGPETTFCLLHEDSDEPIFRVDTGVLSDCEEPRFSPVGQHVAWGDQQGTVYICDINEVRRRLARAGLDHPMHSE